MMQQWSNYEKKLENSLSHNRFDRNPFHKTYLANKYLILLYHLSHILGLGYIICLLIKVGHDGSVQRYCYKIAIHSVQFPGQVVLPKIRRIDITICPMARPNCHLASYSLTICQEIRYELSFGGKKDRFSLKYYRSSIYWFIDLWLHFYTHLLFYLINKKFFILLRTILLQISCKLLH